MATEVSDGTSLRYARLTDLIEVVEGGIVSRPLFEDGSVKQVLFAMDGGQSLSEHSAPAPATVQVLDGQVTVRVLKEDHLLTDHDWLMMPANAAHGVVAQQPTRFLLTLFKHRESNP